MNRRDFIAFSAVAASMLGFAGCATLAKNPRKPRPIAAGAKIRLAQIGCGGKGFWPWQRKQFSERVGRISRVKPGLLASASRGCVFR